MKAMIALAASILLLTGCNTWEGVKQDARVIGDTTFEGSRRVGRALSEPLATPPASEPASSPGQAQP